MQNHAKIVTSPSIIARIVTFAQIMEQISASADKKLAAKVPHWEGLSLSVPQSLNIEQCSSSATALYKAGVAALMCSGVTCGAYDSDEACGPACSDGTSVPGEACVPCRIADLTGGLGVDSWAFSRVFARVLHNERDVALSQAVQHNFELLGLSNAEFTALDADDPAMLAELKAFAPDVVFMDPARRSATGKKLFLLEDCSPNVIGLLPALLDICPRVLIKISPMADISMLRQRLGALLRRVHIVEVGGECKELLCELVMGDDAPKQSRASRGELIEEQGGENGGKLSSELAVRVVKVGLDADNALKVSAVFDFSPSYEREAPLSLATAEDLAPGMLLFEPGSALMKSGAYKLIGLRGGMRMISPESHMYIFGESQATILLLGRSYVIDEVVDFSGSAIKAIGRKYPVADVSAKGIMMSSDDLRVRLRVKSGGPTHIFGILGPDSRKLLIVTHRR